MQATAHGGAGNFRTVADLGNGQVPLALLERLHHGQSTRQRGHEVRVAGQGLDPLGGGSNDRRCHRSEGVAQLIVHTRSFSQTDRRSITGDWL
ncbi:hypothetical protein D3C84_854020 [compost metagenome]